VLVAAVLNEQGSPEKKEGEAAWFAGIGGPARAIYSQWGGISKMRAQEMCLTSLWAGSGGGEGDPRRGARARSQQGTAKGFRVMRGEVEAVPRGGAVGGREENSGGEAKQRRGGAPLFRAERGRRR